MTRPQPVGHGTPTADGDGPMDQSHQPSTDRASAAAKDIVPERPQPKQKPYGFPPRVLSTTGSRIRYHRYHDGRLSITSPAPMTVLANVLVPPRPLDHATLEGYLSLLGQVLTPTSVAHQCLTFLTLLGPTHARATYEIRGGLGRAEGGVEKHTCQSDVFARTLRLVVRPMALIRVHDYEEVLQDEELVKVWEELVDRLVSEEERDYVDDACLALVAGIECDEYPDGMYADSPDPTMESTRFRLRERYALVVGDGSPAVDHYMSTTESCAIMSEPHNLLSHLPRPTLPLALPSPHAVPEILLATYFTNTRAFNPRYSPDTGGLMLRGHPLKRYQVLVHAPVPLRTLATPHHIESYLDEFAENQYRLEARIPELALFQALVTGGFGSWTTHAAATNILVCCKRIQTDRILMQACCSPFYVVAVADQDLRVDWWEALKTLCNDPVPDDAVLGLILGMECKGLEEMKADTVVPPVSDRQYTLCERVAILTRSKNCPHPAEGPASVAPSTSPPTPLHHSSPPPALHPRQTHARALQPPSSNQLESALHATHTAHLQAPPYGTPLDLLTAPVSKLVTLWRYKDGVLYFFDLDGKYSQTLSHALISPRALPPTLAKRYLHALSRHIHPGASRDVHQYAIMQKGPLQPFTFAPAAKSSNVYPSNMKKVLDRAIARAVYCVGQASNVQHGDHIWATLSAKARKWGVAEADIECAEAVVLIGLEIVGLENSKPSDVLPGWADRQFVVRERYALVKRGGGSKEDGRRMSSSECSTDDDGDGSAYSSDD